MRKSRSTPRKESPYKTRDFYRRISNSNADQILIPASSKCNKRDTQEKRRGEIPAIGTADVGVPTKNP